jgi:hypothetical protein
MEPTSARIPAVISESPIDTREIVETGDEVEHACEQCHSQFWYPGDKRLQ